MRPLVRFILAAATFAFVWGLPLLSDAGLTGAGSDLGLSRHLGAGSWLAFGIAFGGGIATSLTPCVYPLIPMTVSLFGARGAAQRGHAVALSGLYVLGIASMYAALGASAALTGKAFGAAMQNPLLLGLVTAVFAAMGFSMLGAFDLQLPSSIQTRLSRVGGTGFLGAFAMGLVAGIIAAPCTGPVLAAALAFVATKGSVVFGTAILFVYALGLGSLFFLIGAFSLSLPKSGPWMETVKGVFGVAMLAMALSYARDLFPGLRPLFSPSASAAFIAALVAGAGVIMGGFDGAIERTTGQKAVRGVALAMTTLAVAYAAGAGNARSVARSRLDLAWLVNQEQEGLATAREARRPMVIDFWADWCAACKELDRTAWSDPRVRAEAERFVLVKMDNSADKMADARSAELVDRVFEKYGVLGQPTVLFIDSRGRELPGDTRVTAVVSAEEMLARLRAVDAVCDSRPRGCSARW